MVATLGQPKKKPLSQQQAMAQAQAPQPPQSVQQQHQAFKDTAQQAFDQGGFKDFFAVSDHLAAANSGTGNVYTASDAIAQILANPNTAAPARANNAGQTFAAGKDAPPPPPPPPAPVSPAPVAPGPTAPPPPLFASPRGPAPGAAPTTTPAPTVPAADPNAPLTEADQARIAQLRAEFEADLQKQLAAGKFDPESIGRGFRNAGPIGLSAQGAAEARRILNEIAGQLSNYTQAGSQNVLQQLAPTASTVNNGALERSATLAPNANQSSGLNTAITALLGDQAGLDLPINGDLRSNQAATMAAILNRADEAGREAVTGLSLPDLTASNVPARTLSSLEQATEQRALDRVTGGRFLNPESELIGQAEQVILQNLLGGDNPLIQQQRQAYLDRSADSEAQLIEDLQRLGVLTGSGNTADILGEFRGQRDRGLTDIDALAFDMQREAALDALGFQGRRDNLALAEQDLQRAAISDARGISDTRNQLDLAEANLSGNLRGEATLPARLAQAGLQFDAANLQQDVTDRTAARLSTLTSPTELERFNEGVRQAQFGETLASRADNRARMALESDLFGEVREGANTAPRQTLTGRGFDLNETLALNQDDRASQALMDALFGEVGGRQTLSGRVTQSGLTTDALNRSLAQIASNRQGTQLADDLKTSALNRLLATNADDRAGRGFEDDLLTSELNRLLAGNADTRADELQTRQLGDTRIAQILAAAEAGYVPDNTATGALMRALGLAGAPSGVTVRDAGGGAQGGSGGAPSGIAAAIASGAYGGESGGVRNNSGPTGTDLGNEDFLEALRALQFEMALAQRVRDNGGIDNVTPRDTNTDRQIWQQMMEAQQGTGQFANDVSTAPGGPVTPELGALTAEEILIVEDLIKNGQTREQAVQNVLRIRDR